MTQAAGDGPPFRVSHVIFDVDGTLVDFVGAFEVATRATAEFVSGLRGQLVTATELRETQRQAARELRAEGRTRAEVRDESLRQALALHGCDEAAIAAGFETFERTRDAHLVPYDDVEPALSTLQQRGVTMVAASNGTVEMAQLPVFGYFAATWFAGDVGIAKPDPRFFLAALEHVGASPAEALMVGDRLDNDYEPARAVGMHAVLIDRERRVDDPAVCRITTLAELPALVEPLPAASQRATQ